MAYRNTVLEVNTKHLLENYKIYKEVSDKDVFVVVKANAYGLGLKEVSKVFEKEKVSYLCTATFEEAMILREEGLLSPILVMGYTRHEDLGLAKKNNITITIVDSNYAKNINVLGLKVHLKVNTSMNRLGHNNYDELIETLNLLKDNHDIEGIYTHYSTCDQNVCDQDFNKFKEIVDKLDVSFKYIHASSSRSALYYKEDYTNAVRIGIGLYGGLDDFKLKCVATLKTEVVSLRKVTQGDRISYEGNYTVSKDSIIATLPIGYADGVLRADTGNKVRINDKLYPIVGNICMDQLMLEVDESVTLHDTVEIFGESISITHIANHRNTINYEVLTGISNRVERKYI